MMNNWASARDFATIANAQMPLINAIADVSGEARDLNFCLSLHLHPCFVYASTEDSGEYAHMQIHAYYRICANVSNEYQC